MPWRQPSRVSVDSCTTRRNIGTMPIRRMRLYDCRTIGNVHFRHDNNRVEASQSSNLAAGSPGKKGSYASSEGREKREPAGHIRLPNSPLGIGPNHPKRAPNKYSRVP